MHMWFQWENHNGTDHLAYVGMDGKIIAIIIIIIIILYLRNRM